MADGVDNLNPDGSFDCGGHNLFGRPGNARWVTTRWTRGTSAPHNDVSWRCGNGHHTDVTFDGIPSREDHGNPPDRCSGTIDGHDGTVPCPSRKFEYTGGYTAHGPNSGQWPYEMPTPRTCTFCGGVHPDDAIALIAAGFRLAGTDKGYKHYIEVPAGNPGLVPPLKLYGNHVSQAQADAINAAIRARKVA